ncbi:MAG: DotH/IcmK family type IV secretion protein [Gammaproteobacteria bacterium]
MILLVRMLIATLVLFSTACFAAAETGDIDKDQAQFVQQVLTRIQPQKKPDGSAAAVPDPNAQAAQQPGQNPVAVPAKAETPPEQPDMYEDAFTNVVNQLLPMSPDQITRLKAAFNEAQKAAVQPVGVPPRPTSSSIVVDLQPRATPPVIRLQAGYITSLVIMDSTGQPWPISAYSLGDPSAFNIQWDKKSNTLLIQSVTFYKRTNLAIMLKGLNTPVMLSLLSGQEAVDYRVDLHVPGMGPNAMVEQNGLPGVANPVLLDVLNGIPPRGSKPLKVLGGECQAWYIGRTLFLRTNLDIISPAWRSIMTSMDGTHAYELQTSPVVLALEHGKDKTITLTLEGWE